MKPSIIVDHVRDFSYDLCYYVLTMMYFVQVEIKDVCLSVCLSISVDGDGHITPNVYVRSGGDHAQKYLP